jgi:hypothetical protein
VRLGTPAAGRRIVVRVGCVSGRLQQSLRSQSRARSRVRPAPTPIADRALVLASTFSFADAPDCGLAFVAALGPTVALEQGNVVLKDRS